MISWGTRNYQFGEYRDTITDTCPICSKQEYPTYTGVQSVFVLYGMSMFPSGVTYYRVCSNCDARLKVKARDLNLPKIQREMPRKMSFSYFWGWLVVLPVLYGIYYFFTEVVKLDK